MGLFTERNEYCQSASKKEDKDHWSNLGSIQMFKLGEVLGNKTYYSSIDLQNIFKISRPVISSWISKGTLINSNPKGCNIAIPRDILINFIISNDYTDYVIHVNTCVDYKDVANIVGLSPSAIKGRAARGKFNTLHLPIKGIKFSRDEVYRIIREDFNNDPKMIHRFAEICYLRVSDKEFESENPKNLALGVNINSEECKSKPSEPYLSSIRAFDPKMYEENIKSIQGDTRPAQDLESFVGEDISNVSKQGYMEYPDSLNSLDEGESDIPKTLECLKIACNTMSGRILKLTQSCLKNIHTRVQYLDFIEELSIMMENLESFEKAGKSGK